MERSDILLYDTTLRDGTQGHRITFSAEDKLRIATRLDEVGFHYIEGGWPGSNPRDMRFFRMAGEVTFKSARLTAFGSTRRSGMAADECPNIRALLEADTPAVAVFGKSWDLHAKEILGVSLDENLSLIGDSVRYLKSKGKEVVYDAEHFFDGYKHNPEYALRTVRAALEAGADSIALCDTNGGTLTWELMEIIGETVSQLSPPCLGIHAHDDCGLALANSLAAVEAGAEQVECTINGIGERAGNCALEEIVMALRTRHDALGYDTRVETEHIYATSKLLSTITGIVVQPNKAIVGANAFAHEAGIHQHGVMMEKSTYEIMTPESIGLTQNKLVLGKHSGRHAFAQRLEELGYTLGKEDLERAFVRFKTLADQKKDIFDEDLDAIVADEIIRIPEKFKLLQMNVSSGSFAAPTATVAMEIDGKVKKAAMLGSGPVDATFKTIKKMTRSQACLLSFTVGAITGGTDAQGECTVRLELDGREALGQGAHPDIIVASAKAYINALNKLAIVMKKQVSAHF